MLTSKLGIVSVNQNEKKIKESQRMSVLKKIVSMKIAWHRTVLLIGDGMYKTVMSRR